MRLVVNRRFQMVFVIMRDIRGFEEFIAAIPFAELPQYGLEIEP